MKMVFGAWGWSFIWFEVWIRYLAVIPSPCIKLKHTLRWQWKTVNDGMCTAKEEFSFWESFRGSRSTWQYPAFYRSEYEVPIRNADAINAICNFATTSGWLPAESWEVSVYSFQLHISYTSPLRRSYVHALLHRNNTRLYPLMQSPWDMNPFTPSLCNWILHNRSIQIIRKYYL